MGNRGLLAASQFSEFLGYYVTMFVKLGHEDLEVRIMAKNTEREMVQNGGIVLLILLIVTE